MAFTLGTRSRANLQGVHPDLVKVVQRAIQITSQDFTVIEGLRDIQRQEELLRRGATQTMNSRHLTGHAVDITPWVNGEISWDWKYYPEVLDAFIKACKEVDVPLRWGGNWSVQDLRTWKSTGEALREAYKGKFRDGPHLEIPRGFGYD